MKQPILVHTCIIVTLCLLLTASLVTKAAEIIGPVTRIKDGDSLFIWNTEIRLVDIDAFEFSQKCSNDNGLTHCGVLASNALKQLVKDQELRCHGSSRDRFERLLATCYAGSKNVNEAMVYLGWAVNYKHGTKYAEAELDARLQKRGAWDGSFMDPYQYRRKSHSDLKAEPQFAKPENGHGKCVIKGNISVSGKKIYHTPWGSKNYSRTNISPKYGERWFCSEEEALQAGWRPPKR